MLSCPYVVAAGVAVVVVVLAALVSLATPAGARYHEGIVLVWLCCLLLLLTGSALLYGRAVVDRQPAVGWLATAAVCTATYTASFALRLYVDPDRPLPVADAVDLLMALMWLGMVAQATRVRPPVVRPGPFVLGALVGAAGIGLQVLVHRVGPIVGESTGRHLVAVGLVLVGLATVGLFLHSDQLGGDVRTPLLVACALATVSRALTPAVPTAPGVRPASAALLGLVATALFCREAAQLLRQAREQLAVVARLQAAELVEHDQREQLHEVRAGLAALGFAARLLARDDGALSGGRRRHLATMMEDEMHRLGRLVDDRRDRPDAGASSVEDVVLEAVEVDDVLETVVTERQLCGQRVEWEPVGQVVAGSRDGLVEALSILLVNAAQHAPGATVRVTGETDGDQLRLVVADDGPGIPPDLQPHLFVRGSHGEESRGEGLGLSLAHRIVASLGGELRLAESCQPAGAAFEVVLRLTTTEVVA